MIRDAGSSQMEKPEYQKWSNNDAGNCGSQHHPEAAASNQFASEICFWW